MPNCKLYHLFLSHAQVLISYRLDQVNRSIAVLPCHPSLAFQNGGAQIASLAVPWLTFSACNLKSISLCCCGWCCFSLCNLTHSNSFSSRSLRNLSSASILSLPCAKGNKGNLWSVLAKLATK